jgi:hypothetical protein
MTRPHLRKWKRVKDSNLRDRAQNATSWPLNEPASFLFARPKWHSLPVLPRLLDGENIESWLVDEGSIVGLASRSRRIGANFNRPAYALRASARQPPLAFALLEHCRLAEP